MDDPVRRSLRATRSSGLTSPEPVTAPTLSSWPTDIEPPARSHEQAAETASNSGDYSGRVRVATETTICTELVATGTPHQQRQPRTPTGRAQPSPSPSAKSHETSGRRSVGRPRDDRVDVAVRDAAQRVFLKHGWAKFTFESVANEAGVGKPALYRRWPSREALLIDCLKGIEAPLVPDLGSFKEELRLLASEFLKYVLNTDGAVFFRLLAESIASSEIAPLLTKIYNEPRSKANREITIRGIQRGEVKRGTSPSMVAEMVSGAALFHYLYTPPEVRRKIADNVDEYSDKIVDLVLAAVAVEKS
jgi:AcrR family transcriptional regulator